MTSRCKRPPRRLWASLGCLAAAGLLELAGHRFPEWTERFVARGLYRGWSEAMARLTGWLPFSLVEWVIVAAVAAVPILLVWMARQRKKPGFRNRLAGWGLNLLCGLSGGLLLFVLICGLNYARRPFSQQSGLVVQESSPEELRRLCFTLADQANALRSQLTEDETGAAQGTPQGLRTAGEEARAAMQRLGERYPALSGYYPPPKRVFFSRFMSRLELTGVYVPFTMEANVNVDCPSYTIPATMCHELSHLRGFMREDEANFIAYLACMESDRPELRYSGTFLALVHAGNQLYRVDPEAYRELLANYGEGLLRDMQDNNAYWRQFEGTVLSSVSKTVNDTYLRANRQEDGIQSYGRMVDLLLALQRTGSLTGSAA